MTGLHTRTSSSPGASAPVVANGDAMAAMLAAGVGAFAMGLFVILHETGLFVSPSLYAPAGGLSGRTTFAVIVWLIAWSGLHLRWNQHVVSGPRVFLITLLLVLLGVIGRFPPAWGLF